MPEVNQYTFSHKEIVELMIKKIGLHEGRWMLQITFGFAALNGGPSPEQAMPSGVVGVQTIGLIRAQPESPASLTVDAAEVNPASSEKKLLSKQSGGVSQQSS
jgi:hypothetical protein